MQLYWMIENIKHKISDTCIKQFQLYEKQEKIGELLKLIEKRIILNSKTIELEKQAKEAILNKTIGGN